MAAEEPAILSAKILQNSFSNYLISGRLGGSEPLSELSLIAFDTARLSDGPRRILAYVLANVLSAVSEMLAHGPNTLSDVTPFESRLADTVERSIEFLCERGDMAEAINLALELIDIQIELSL